MDLNTWARAIRKRFFNIEHLVAIKDSCDSPVTQTVLSGDEINKKNSKFKFGLLLKFSTPFSSVHQFDEDLGLNIITMKYAKDRCESHVASPWFLFKINAGLRVVSFKRGTSNPQQRLLQWKTPLWTGQTLNNLN